MNLFIQDPGFSMDPTLNKQINGGKGEVLPYNNKLNISSLNNLLNY